MLVESLMAQDMNRSTADRPAIEDVHPGVEACLLCDSSQRDWQASDLASRAGKEEREEVDIERITAKDLASVFLCAR